VAKVFVINETGITKPRPVREFTSLDLGFDMLNPLQTSFAANGLHTRDCNVICTWPTSAGKTVCAELVCEIAMREGKKVIYACPLKSLAEEKVRRFKKLFPERRVEVFTGDYRDVEQRSEKAKRADIAIVTTELLDSVSRTRVLSEILLSNCHCIVSDEAHILATERGPALEGALIRISSQNKKIRHLLLSATVPNSEELASWIKSLNGKDTFVLKGKWRPVSIGWHILEVKPSKPRKAWRKAAVEKVAVLVRMLLSAEKDARVLLFVWTKGEGRLLEERLRQAQIPTSFHNAELELEERLDLEEAFERGAVRVLISTTTLAWGRNTSARHVILFGKKRGIEYINGWDILQAGGRAGRAGKTNRGDVWWIVADTEHAEDVLTNPPAIRSHLTNPSALAFQLLGELPLRGKKSLEEITDWFRKTFAMRCLRKGFDPGELFSDALSILEKTGCAIFDEEKKTLHLTGVGRVARRFYVRPEEISCISTVLLKIIKAGFDPESKEMTDILAILFTAHSAASTRKIFLAREEQAELESVHTALWVKKYNDLMLSDVHAWCAYQLKTWHFFHSKNPSGTFPHFKIREFIWDMDRIILVSSSLAREVFCAPQKLISSIEKLGKVIRYGAPPEAKELLEIRGIGAKRAIELLKLGIKTREDIVRAVRNGKGKQIAKILPIPVIQEILSEPEVREYSFSF